MRISIMAGGSSSRPDTLTQTGSAADLDKPLADGAGHTFLKAVTIRSSWAGWRGLALMWEKPSFLRSLPT